ncbi:UNVERIFIED_CONTAM: hypothetical protein K2H54_047764 [Gekko kuhli]
MGNTCGALVRSSVMVPITGSRVRRSELVAGSEPTFLLQNRCCYCCIWDYKSEAPGRVSVVTGTTPAYSTRMPVEFLICVFISLNGNKIFFLEVYLIYSILSFVKENVCLSVCLSLCI